MTERWTGFSPRWVAPTLMVVSMVGAIAGCTTNTTTRYEATAYVTYTWQVMYTSESEGRRDRIEKFASTSLENHNGERPGEAVTGPDDQGLWWPELPPRPTVDDIESRQKPRERAGTPELMKQVEYTISFDLEGQPRTLPTNYSVYRTVVKAYPEQRPLELTLGVNEGSVTKAEPQ